MEINYRRDLHRLLSHFGLPLVAAEIGVAEGLFSRDMLSWGLDCLYCVDNWGHMAEASGDGSNSQEWHMNNLRKAQLLLAQWVSQDKAIFLRGYSSEMAQRVPESCLGLLYLDGDHTYEGVLRDLEKWFSKVVAGGIIAGHDFLAPQYGVQEAVHHFCQDRFQVHTISEDKAEDAGFWFQVAK